MRIKQRSNLEAVRVFILNMRKYADDEEKKERDRVFSILASTYHKPELWRQFDAADLRTKEPHQIYELFKNIIDGKPVELPAPRIRMARNHRLPKTNLQRVREFLTLEIERLKGQPFHSDTVLEYQDALETLSAFEQTAKGKEFDATDFHKSDANFIYQAFRNTLLRG